MEWAILVIHLSCSQGWCCGNTSSTGYGFSFFVISVLAYCKEYKIIGRYAVSCNSNYNFEVVDDGLVVSYGIGVESHEMRLLILLKK